MLVSMASQDGSNGQPFCFIDPHGDAAEELKTRVPTALYWDVGDPECVLGFNPLKRVDDAHRSLAVSGLIDALKKQWEDAWGARMEHLLRYALLALMEHDDATLAAIMPLFLDKERREKVVADIQDVQVRSFWQIEYPAMNYRTSVDGVAPIANKIGAFLAHPIIRRSLCSPERPIDFSRLLSERQSLIVNLSKGRIGADMSNVVGGLIVSAFAFAAYQRQSIPQSRRLPYFLYVDEFHSFTTDGFATFLSELRKYGLGLIATTQHISQLSNSVRDAVFGNVGTLISFRVGAADAPILARQFGGEVPSISDLVNSPNHEFYIKLMIDGAQSKPFSARTLLPTH